MTTGSSLPISNLISPLCLPLCVPHTWAGLTSLSPEAGPSRSRSDTSAPALRGSDTRSRLSLGSVIFWTQAETDGHSDIWDKLKKCREFLVSHW